MSGSTYDQNIPSDEAVPELNSVRGSQGPILGTAQNHFDFFAVFVQDVLCILGNFLSIAAFGLSEDPKSGTKIFRCLFKRALRGFSSSDQQCADMAVFIKIQPFVRPAVFIQDGHLVGELLFIGRADPDCGDPALIPAGQLFLPGGAVQENRTRTCFRNLIRDIRDSFIRDR